MSRDVGSRQVQLPDDDALIQELLTLEARPTRSGATFIGATSGAKDDRASVIAALMDTTATAITPESVSRFRELIAELGSPDSGGGSRFGSVIGVPGVSFGLDRLDR
jgi:hypothetical protein